MDKKSDAEFENLEFEKRLLNLKDTQDSIQAMSAWCLQHKSYHKKIVGSWLTILKQGLTKKKSFFSIFDQLDLFHFLFFKIFLRSLDILSKYVGSKFNVFFF